MHPEDCVDGCVGHLFGDLFWVVVGEHYCWEREEYGEEKRAGQTEAAANMPAHWREGREYLYQGYDGASLTEKSSVESSESGNGGCAAYYSAQLQWRRLQTTPPRPRRPRPTLAVTQVLPHISVLALYIIICVNPSVHGRHTFPRFRIRASCRWPEAFRISGFCEHAS